MLTWENGIAVGRALEQIKSHEHRITAAETGLEKLEADVLTLRGYMVRALLLAVIWTAGLGGNLSAEQVGQALAGVITGMRK